ncbi:FixH family protein [Magnetospirillum molischianum]|uniref:Predicted integral membrane protein linked to a cation pump n=1 Tax=Magnetospirillum molischianum DSM 120 TaxID=1150626 RepID=H8FX23_MAGML|nr:FixH family protein [Magnetospirillum molischianum]CCG42911.1 Predicted integral membrane protein linked to a cation pump [Magnetospirillum molischianum DSM 120]
MTADRRPGWWYPYIFVAVFGVVVAVNATMAWLAGSTFPGLSAERAYDKGLAYNQALEAARRQEALGWSVMTMTDPIPNGSGIVIAQTYRDRDGHPIDGLQVRVHLSRPAVQNDDRNVVLSPSGPGDYAVIVVLPLPGLWDLQAVAEGGGVSYQSFRRFVAP